MSIPCDRRPVRFNIIGKSNGVGLERDLMLLSGALRESGHEVSVTIIDDTQARRRRSAFAQWKVRANLAWDRRKAAAPTVPKADVNLMLEHVWLQYLAAARVNVAVPNPEWFDRHDRSFLSKVDCVWAKTGNTLQLFRSLGCEATFIGFDSEDRHLPAVRRERSFFHLAGKSSMKGTDRLLGVWARHPHWPNLIVVQHRGENHLPEVAADNIELRTGYLDDADLRALQNRSMFHICLSLTEGWGHYIAEALSVGAVTITVDAPPMNELVTPDRGLLVQYETTGTQRLATTYRFDEAALEAVIERAIAMDMQECAELGSNARQWFTANKRGFSGRLTAALHALPAH
jgi:glycosyltransferase involved in cell wall biosynthesis